MGRTQRCCFMYRIVPTTENCPAKMIIIQRLGNLALDFEPCYLDWLLDEHWPHLGAFWRGHWRQWRAPTPVLLPGDSQGQGSLVGCSPWGHEESDATERLHFHFSLSCIGEGNGNPLQCSCLENPRDRRAWWAAVYGVAQSRTRLMWLSSSSSSSRSFLEIQTPGVCLKSTIISLHLTRSPGD